MAPVIIGDEMDSMFSHETNAPIKSTLGIFGRDSIAVRITARVWDRYSKWGRLGFTEAVQIPAKLNGVPGRGKASSFLLSTVGDAFRYH